MKGRIVDYDVKPVANPPSPKSVAAGSSTPDPRIEILEGKVQLLNDHFNALKEKLEFFTQKRVERDDIVIELFKMLRDNLDSRSQLIDKLSRDDFDHVMSSADENSSNGTTDSPSNVSSLEKHIKKKS